LPRRPRPLRRKRYYTTGEVARIVGVSQSLVIRWLDEGAMPGFTWPCTRDRRVTHATLVAWVAAHPEGEIDLDAILGPGEDGETI
jgi:excisionase family DNA binding protein